MAVAPTGAIYKSLVFDGEDSRDYGVYITGEAVYNAPEREVEMISIPGRSGAFALDKGRFENIEVSYPAGIFADNETDFAEAISDFRNFLCSRRGYVRLTDEYNPNEYRMAIYKSGLEVTPAQLKAGEFNITFDCKPQRWLTSGEDAVTMGEWGDTETASGAIATFEGDEATGIKSLVVDIEPVQSGSGTPSPDNVRPISGYDSVSVANMGDISERQFFNGLMQGTYGFVDMGTLNWGTIGSRIYTTSLANLTPHMASNARIANILTTNYDTISANGTASAVKGISVDTGGAVIVYDAEYSGDAQAFKTAMSGVYLIYELTTPTTPTITKAQFDVLLEQFGIEGELYVTDLSSTRYGGTLDVVSGVLTVDRGMIDMTSITDWTVDAAAQRIYKIRSDMKPNTSGDTVPNLLSNRFEAVTPNEIFAHKQGVSLSAGSALQFHINGLTDSASVTLAQVNQYFIDNPTQVVYELATPQTVQLTAQQVSALVGTNNIWANSGDISVEYGTAPNMLVNPTLFESSPLLEVEGLGTIAFNGYEITFDNGLFGDTVLIAATQINSRVKKFSLPSSVYASGDTMTFDGASVNWEIRAGRGHTITAGSVTAQSGATTSVVERTSLSKLKLKTIFAGTTFTAGTTYADEATATIQLTEMGGATASVSVKISFTYNATNETFTFTFLETAASSGFGTYHDSTIMKDLSVDSTVYALGHPTYIDCDLGDAYKIDDGVYTSLNSHIDLGSDLPKLASGVNEITYDNTITELKIHPRWWKV